MIRLTHKKLLSYSMLISLTTSCLDDSDIKTKVYSKKGSSDAAATLGDMAPEKLQSVLTNLQRDVDMFSGKIDKLKGVNKKLCQFLNDYKTKCHSILHIALDKDIGLNCFGVHGLDDKDQFKASFKVSLIREDGAKIPHTIKAKSSNGNEFSCKVLSNTDDQTCKFGSEMQGTISPTLKELSQFKITPDGGKQVVNTKFALIINYYKGAVTGTPAKTVTLPSNQNNVLQDLYINNTDTNNAIYYTKGDAFYINIGNLSKQTYDSTNIGNNGNGQPGVCYLDSAQIDEIEKDLPAVSQ